MSIENGHPHQCHCGSQYTTGRYAARCCKVSSTDLRDGTVTVYSVEAELEAQAADEAHREAMEAEYHYGCSCGESYNSLSAAVSCRKCRTYTSEGYCTEVIDLNADNKVVWSIAAARELAGL